MNFIIAFAWQGISNICVKLKRIFLLQCLYIIIVCEKGCMLAFSATIFRDQRLLTKHKVHKYICFKPLMIGEEVNKLENTLWS